MNIGMVVTDLDGSFLRRDKTVSDYSWSVIKRLRDRGIPFVIATARPIRGVKILFDNSVFDYAIYHNGAVITNNSETLMNIGISNPYELVKTLLDINPNYHIAVEDNDTQFSNFDSETIWRGVAYTYTSDFSEIKDSIADKLLIESTDLSAIEGALPDDCYAQVSENRVIMIMNKSATKLNAIKLLCDKTGIPLESVAAFGDDYNDIDMLEGVGSGVAVDNALDIVKNSAKYVCGTNDADGIAHWLNENALR